MLKKKWVKTGLAALLFSCLSVGAFAQDNSNTYYEGKTWNQFYGRYDYLQGSASEVCAASIAAWDKVTHVTHVVPNYTQTIVGIYHGSYRDMGRYLYCDASLKTFYVYDNPDLNMTQFIEDFDNVIHITKTEERPVDPDPCLTRSGEQCEDSCQGKGVYTDQRGNIVKDYGGQSCRNGVIEKACAWPDNFLETNERAKEIIRECVLEHEEQHMRDKDKQYCNDVGQGSANGRANFLPQHRNKGECDGHIVEVICLDKAIAEDACDGDAECLSQINTRRDEMFISVAGNPQEGTRGYDPGLEK